MKKIILKDLEIHKNSKPPTYKQPTSWGGWFDGYPNAPNEDNVIELLLVIRKKVDQQFLIEIMNHNSERFRKIVQELLKGSTDEVLFELAKNPRDKRAKVRNF